MKLQEFREQIRDMGFEDDAIFTEYVNVIINALNRSLDIINTTVKPIIGKLDITQDGTGTGTARYDLSELCVDGQGNPIYEALDGMPMRAYNNTYYPFGRYTLEQNKIISMDASLEGVFTFFYTQQIPHITISTPDDYELPIDPEVEPLLPLLVAYYVWLDDDERKAVMYYNQFDSMKNEILEKIRGRNGIGTAEIYGGIGWN